MGVVSTVLSGDVDERLKAGRVLRESKEAPRDIGLPNPIPPFSVAEAAEERGSKEFQPNATGVGLGDSMSRTPSMTWRKARVGVAERGCCCCLPNTFGAAVLDEEDDEGLINRGE